MTRENPKRKLQFVLDYLRQHRLHMVVFVTVVIYLCGHYVRLEFFGHGSELLVEPMLEVVIARFLGTES